MTLKQLYFSFKGRIGRKTFWLKGILPWTILSIVILCILGLVIQWAYSMNEEMLMMMDLVYLPILLVLLWSILAIFTKRYHDLDKSGWWILGILIPLGLVWVLLQTGLSKGTDGPNRFGEETF